MENKPRMFDNFMTLFQRRISSPCSPSSSDSPNSIPFLSPIANSVVARCSKILNMSTEDLCSCFDVENGESGNKPITYARHLLEFCCYRAFNVLTARADYLSDKEFRRLTYDMMLAWEAPGVDGETLYKESASPSRMQSEDDDGWSLFYSSSTATAVQVIHMVDNEKTVGPEAFARIAPVQNLFDALTNTSGNRLHFLIYEKYLQSLGRVIKSAKNVSSVLSNLEIVDGEIIVDVDGTVPTQPILQHIGISAWPEFWSADQRYWWPTKNVCYTVKSGYLLARLGKQRAWSLSHGVLEEELWKRVWGVKGPLKLQHFVWRGCKGSLGVKERLWVRHIVNDSICQGCGAATETINHALFDCLDATIIWSYSAFQDLLAYAPNSSFCDRFLWVANRLSKNELSLFCMLCGAAWFCRNARVHNELVADPSGVAANFTKMLNDYKEYAERVFRPAGSCDVAPLGTWRLPAAGNIKVNFDAHLAANNIIGLGVVLRDEAGSIIAAAVKRMKARWSVEQAEVAAARWGMQIAKQLGHLRIELECDAANVVNIINKNDMGGKNGTEEKRWWVNSKEVAEYRTRNGKKDSGAVIEQY
ncbi:uncharacterized protein LOC110714988 isoform X5 [Chenopodium quinoa]|uniref:uncharacterized protein LOC110714988 isoform X5 n=1 Tax=Chenopodium quinoa TaxID=63459 RepID=UPI000B7848F1|nr:uncharacterized protein LOC110714988 isoform X5 [Chenopodium quinoa]